MKLQDFGTHTLPALPRSTFLLGPLSFDRQNAGKISLFISLSPLSLSLSLFLYLFASFSPFSSVYFPPLFLFFIPPNSLLSTLFAPIITLLFHFLLTSIFSFSFFSSFYLFSSFLISFDVLLSRLIKVGETSSHFPHMLLVFFTQFPYFLIYFSFPLLHHSTHGSM